MATVMDLPIHGSLVAGHWGVARSSACTIICFHNLVYSLLLSRWRSNSVRLLCRGLSTCQSRSRNVICGMYSIIRTSALSDVFKVFWNFLGAGLLTLLVPQLLPTPRVLLGIF